MKTQPTPAAKPNSDESESTPDAGLSEAGDAGFGDGGEAMPGAERSVEKRSGEESKEEDR